MADCIGPCFERCLKYPRALSVFAVLGATAVTYAVTRRLLGLDDPLRGTLTTRQQRLRARARFQRRALLVACAVASAVSFYVAKRARRTPPAAAEEKEAASADPVRN